MMATPTASRARSAGVLVPLSSCASCESWGIGEIGDIRHVARWLRQTRLGLLQLLPINEMAPGQNSPYSAISAMAIDPIFISVGEVADFAALGGVDSLAAADREALDGARRAPRIDYAAIRELKRTALRAAFERFVAAAWRHDNARASLFRRYVQTQSWWLDDYALFRAIHASAGEKAWTVWDPSLAAREPQALEQARRDLEHEILLYQYLQWIAHEQWDLARSTATGVAILGDLPFMVDTDSADVWANQDQFMLDGAVGVPPDAFSETGQNWGLPVYRWDKLRDRDYEWLRRRARRAADLFDGYRLDHLVGFYRTYVFPRDGSAAYFTPSDRAEQVCQGEEVLRVLAEPGARLIVEDLGTVPDYVRESLARLRVPGYKVLRWEREWEEEEQPFRDPVAYAAVSVATSGTHDTETMAAWWEAADEKERRQVLGIPTIAALMKASASGSADETAQPDASVSLENPDQPRYSDRLRDWLLEALFASGSDMLILPVQDIFGWRDRINVPATVGDDNWTYKLPWPTDELDRQPEARERARVLGDWAERHGRTVV